MRVRGMVAAGLAGVLGLGVMAPGADAATRHRTASLSGTVMSASESSIMVVVAKANKVGREWADAGGGSVTITVVPKTKVRGPHRLARASTDLRAGDFVQLTARESDDQSELDARTVGLKLQAYEGTLSAFSFDGTTGSAGVQWTSANKAAQAWLAANGSPNPVTMAITADSKVGGSPAAGAAVAVQARVSAGSPSSLEVVALESP